MVGDDDDDDMGKTSFFRRFYDFVQAFSSRDLINFEHVRHKCEPNQRSFASVFLERLAKRYQDRRNDEAKCTRQRPPAAPKVKQDSDLDNKKKKPPKIDPPTESNDDLPRCFIKEQNPLAPPCCDVQSDDEEDDDDDGPCPPPGYPQDPRAPTCGCDRCRKSGYHGRCCDRRTYVQQSAETPPMLEKA